MERRVVIDTKITNGKIMEGKFCGEIFLSGTISSKECVKSGTFRDEKIYGTGSIKYYSGKIIEGEFDNDQLVSGKVLFPNGEYFICKNGEIIKYRCIYNVGEIQGSRNENCFTGSVKLKSGFYSCGKFDKNFVLEIGEVHGKINDKIYKGKINNSVFIGSITYLEYIEHGRFENWKLVAGTKSAIGPYFGDGIIWAVGVFGNIFEGTIHFFGKNFYKMEGRFTWQDHPKLIEGKIYKLDSVENKILQDENLCCICLENERTHLFMNCRHFCVCSLCAELLRICPLCQKEGRVEKIYF